MRLPRNLLVCLLMVFIVSGCSYYSRQEISYLVSGQLIKLRIGMRKSEVARQLGQPNEIHAYPGSKYPNKNAVESLRADMVFCPENLPEILPGQAEIYIYTYNVNPMDKEGYYIFLNRKGKVVGWAVGKNVVPENWNDIVYSKSPNHDLDPSFAPGSLPPLPPEAMGQQPPVDDTIYSEPPVEDYDDEAIKPEIKKTAVKKTSVKKSKKTYSKKTVVKKATSSKKITKSVKKKKYSSKTKKKKVSKSKTKTTTAKTIDKKN